MLYVLQCWDFTYKSYYECELKFFSVSEYAELLYESRKKSFCKEANVLSEHF